MGVQERISNCSISIGNAEFIHNQDGFAELIGTQEGILDCCLLIENARLIGN
jgi:hypothetical protein